MNRRNFLSKSTKLGTAVALPVLSGLENRKPKLLLTIAHITDVHIRLEDNIPSRAIEIIKTVKKYQPDFFLNGGDSIHDASYDKVDKQGVLEQWQVWDDF